MTGEIDFIVVIIVAWTVIDLFVMIFQLLGYIKNGL